MVTCDPGERSVVIQHIATSFDGTVIAVAESERSVEVWDVRSQERIAAFETTMDAGGTRLAITADGRHCVAGAYHVDGIALYDAVSGEEIWRRKDLKKVQSIRISNDDQRILCGFEGKSFEVLNLRNGRSKPSLRGVSDVWESPYDPVTVLDRKRRDFKLTTNDNKQIAALPRTTFAALDFAFAPGKVCLSESGGTIRCFDVRNGDQLWQITPEGDSHALNLVYNESQDHFAAITWPYKTGGNHRLVSLETEAGSRIPVTEISGSCEFGFCFRGSRLVISTGAVLDSSTAVEVGSLDFFHDKSPS